MKKIFSLLLAGMMVLGMAACATEENPDATTNGQGGATTTVGTTTRPLTTPEPTEPVNPNSPADWTLLEKASDWHYKIFTCPFDREGLGAFIPEEDTMAAWFEEKGEEWYKDPAVLAEMAEWDYMTAPMGDRYDALEDNGAADTSGWAFDDNGIICYQQINLTAEQIEWIKVAQDDSIYMDVWYDNAFYVYINGTLVFSHDANGGEGDWTDAVTPVDFDVDVRDLFVEGDNDIVVTLKNCWGGREFIMSIECLYY